MNIHEFLLLIENKLKQSDFSNHKSESREICEHVTGLNPFKVLPDTQIKNNHIAKALKIIQKRQTGTPLAYIIGVKDFYGYTFKINKNVLIPRADSEILVETVINKILSLNLNKPKIIDLCCGSGCLGIAIAKNINCDLTLVDKSKKALQIAQKNSELLSVESKIVHMDVLIQEKLLGLTKNTNIIICNPPYITISEFTNLDPQVKNFEPEISLTDQTKDGLSFYKSITSTVSNLTKKPDILCFEIGYEQGNEVLKICSKIYKTVEVVKDLGGRDRVVIASKNNNLDSKQNY